MRPILFPHRSEFRSRTALLAAAAVGVAALVGCTSSGLSHREVRGQDFATYAFSMYDPSQFTEPADATTGPAAARQPVATPARIAVAQVGEVAPPDLMVEKLRQDQSAFASVQPMPAVVDTAPHAPPYHAPQYHASSAAAQERPRDYSTQQAAREHAQRMRRYARDVGAQYLFLYGGTLDRATTGTGARIADVTIIGAFIVPSQKLEATATASGSLIDVETGRAVLSVSAQARQERMAASAEVQKKELELLTSLRAEVIGELAAQLAEQIKAQAPASSARAE